MITPRPYQEAALDAIWDYFASGKTGHPVIAMPTGTGKSCIPAVFIQRIMQRWPDQRFMVATHVKELISQNYEVMRHAWADAPAGIFSAGLKKKQAYFPIVFGGIQSMARDPSRFGHRDILFIDEAHLVSEEDSSQYLTFISTLLLINPNMKIIGLTATPFRMGMGLITAGKIFTDIIFDLTSLDEFNRLIAEGYIAPLVPKRTHTELSIEGVAISKGEFVLSQLESAVDQAKVTLEALKEAIVVGQNRRSWLIFASGIQHAEHIAAMLRDFGIDCAAVHSKQKPEYNDQAIKAFKNNSLRAIVNFSKLTTGFDHPATDLIVDLRPTMSIPLHIQKLGRGTRIAPGKKDCIAEGSLILTNNGLIPIEKITIYDKIWDGENFVDHDGPIYQGNKEVIEYDGLIATRDHRVYSEKGWQTLGECFEKKIRIAITGNGRKTIQLSENYFGRNSISKTFLYFNGMRYLFKTNVARLYKRYFRKSWMQEVRKFQWRSSQMAFAQNECCAATLYQSKQYGLRTLRSARNTIQIRFGFRSSYLDQRQSWIRSVKRNRQKKQQWSLRSWKSSLFNKSTKSVEYKSERQMECDDASIQIKASSNSLCGYYFKKFVCAWINRRTNFKKIFVKNKTQRVWDIINCGPNHRFTVNGMLVSNCLALDFARNVPRLGPINDPMIPKKRVPGGGDVPVKICEHCGAYNHTKVRFCTNCNAEFEFAVKIFKTSGTEQIIKSDLPQIETFDVDNVIYSKGKKDDKPPYIIATYSCNRGMKQFREFVFPEYSGYVKKRFHDWWRQRHPSEPPITTDDAIAKMFELRTPKQIRVWVNRKYPEILGAEF